MVNYNCASHPHNTYLQWLTEGGLLTIIFFIFYLIALCSFIIKNKGDKNSRTIALIVILILFWLFRLLKGIIVVSFLLTVYEDHD